MSPQATITITEPQARFLTNLLEELILANELDGHEIRMGARVLGQLYAAEARALPAKALALIETSPQRRLTP